MPFVVHLQIVSMSSTLLSTQNDEYTCKNQCYLELLYLALLSFLLNFTSNQNSKLSHLCSSLATAERIAGFKLQKKKRKLPKREK